MGGTRKMINYKIRIKQIRKALFISRKVEPRYTVFDIRLQSLYKAMTDYYCPCEKEVWPEVNRWLKMRKWHHHKAPMVKRILDRYEEEHRFAEERFYHNDHYIHPYKERRKIASYWRNYFKEDIE